MGGNVEPLDITRLVAEHHAALYRYAYRLSGLTADAEDLTQQTFLSAHAKFDQLRTPRPAAAGCSRSCGTAT